MPLSTWLPYSIYARGHAFPTPHSASLSALRSFHPDICQAFQHWSPTAPSLESAQSISLVEAYRKQLLSNCSVFQRTDFGAGHLQANSARNYPISIRELAYYSAKPPKLAQALARIIAAVNPRSVLELGTNFGISTGYILSALNSSAQLVSIEADPVPHQLASSFLATTFPTATYQLINSTFEDYFLSPPMPRQSFDFVFLDGNHQYQPTIDYWNSITAQFLLPNSYRYFLFDDISLKPISRAIEAILSANPSLFRLDFSRAYTLLIAKPHLQLVAV